MSKIVRGGLTVHVRIRESLEPLVLSEFSPSRSEVFRSATERSEALSAEMVTFLPQEKLPAGGRTRCRHTVRYRQKRLSLVRGSNIRGTGEEISPHHRSFPFSSGITNFIASMATPIMESSGSLVVKFCIHMPGRARKLVSGLSWPPT